MPFQRIGHFISSKVAGLAAAGDKSFEEGLEKSYAATATVATAPAPAAAAPAPAAASGVAGLVAAGGIAFAAVGSSLAFIVSQTKSLTLVDVLSAAIVIAAIVMLPAGLFGWLKLRRRNLALLLEGSGWALNDRLKLSTDLAALVTRKPRLPKGATIDRADRLRSAASAIRRDEEEEEQEEGMPWPVKLLVTVIILAALFWQVRVPTVRFACGQQWLSPSACGALLPSEGGPPAAPAPAAPAAPTPAPAKP
jgi:hypothetical protein